MIPRPRACHVEQLALGVIHFLQVGVVADRFDSLLQGNDLIVAGHHRHRTKLQTLGQMHRADRDMTTGGLDVFIENLERQPCILDGSFERGSICAAERTNTPISCGRIAGFDLLRQPVADGLDLFVFACQNADQSAVGR